MLTPIKTQRNRTPDIKSCGLRADRDDVSALNADTARLLALFGGDRAQGGAFPGSPVRATAAAPAALDKHAARRTAALDLIRNGAEYREAARQVSASDRTVRRRAEAAGLKAAATA